MRHHNSNKKFGRESGQCQALLHALVVALITHKSIVTTETRAKSLRSAIEKLVTRAARGTLADRRLLGSRLRNNDEIVNVLIKEIGPKYKDRKGGYTRITKMGQRRGGGDASPLAKIEFV